MQQDTKMYWYNYVLKDYEYIDTPQDFSAYIPQIDAAQALYRLYQSYEGLSPIESAKKVLLQVVGG